MKPACECAYCVNECEHHAVGKRLLPAQWPHSIPLPTHHPVGVPRVAAQSGEMFWFRWKRLPGSYFRLRALSRSYVVAPYAERIRSSPSSVRKLT